MTGTLFRRKSIELILQQSEERERSGHALKRALGVWDLTAFGIAAVVGAGIFSTIGGAAYHGGPAVIFLFLLTAITCGFSALCYAEFASAVPMAGSAYTYAYASFGELFAWIIGWDLICEYAIGNIAVAISWSDYFSSLLSGYGVAMPSYLTMDFVTASRGFDTVRAVLEANAGETLEALVSAGKVLAVQAESYQAWLSAPRLAGVPIICDLPALGIVALVTGLAYLGIQESKRVSNAMVVLKIGVVLLVSAIGAFFIQPANWIPFAPNGASGVLQGVSAVFFAYIGFDAISTTAEECRNPQRDLPRGMMYSLGICTVLYVMVALVLTGMVNYTKLNVGDPLAYVFGPDGANVTWISSVIAVSAVVALTTVLLVFQIGQPRIWMAMSRDGLLPPVFSKIHPKFLTPSFSTILTGVIVGVPALFMNLTEVTDLTSIGTLFAFVLVCGGILMLDPHRPNPEGRFRIPYVSGRYWVPALALIACVGAWVANAEGVRTFWTLFSNPTDPSAPAWEVFRHKIPLLTYLVGMVWIVVQSYRRALSLIPVLGLASAGYLMTELGIVNWIRFGVWLLIGIAVYFAYGVRHSRLGALQKAS